MATYYGNEPLTPGSDDHLLPKIRNVSFVKTPMQKKPEKTSNPKRASHKRKPVVRIYGGKEIEYPSILDASEATGILRGKINYWLSVGRVDKQGNLWRYAGG